MYDTRIVHLCIGPELYIVYFLRSPELQATLNDSFINAFSVGIPSAPNGSTLPPGAPSWPADRLACAIWKPR